MVDAMCRGEAGMAVRRVGCCDCILRDRCRLQFGVGFCDGLVGLEYPPSRRGSGVIEVWLVGCREWRVVVFGSICEPLGVGPGGTVSRIGNRSGRNGMYGC